MIAGNFLLAVAKVLDMILTVYVWIVIARAVLSWVSPDPYNPIIRFIHALTEPVLAPIRRRLPIAFGAVDLSPVVVMLAAVFLQQFVVASLFDIAQRMR
jgi:YggT family protein